MPANLVAQDGQPGEEPERGEGVNKTATLRALGQELDVLQVDEPPLVLGVFYQVDQGLQVEDRLPVHYRRKSLAGQQNFQ